MTSTSASPLETIRFAATHRLCVDLRYNGSRRIIEPYGLRPTKEGGLLLHARRRDSEELRTYRVDKIEDAALTDIGFVPVFNAEMTAGGPLLGSRE